LFGAAHCPQASAEKLVDPKRRAKHGAFLAVGKWSERNLPIVTIWKQRSQVINSFFYENTSYFIFLKNDNCDLGAKSIKK
jgi:hypothetical protein